MLTPARKASPGAIAVLAALLEARTGQHVAADREWRVEMALKPVLRTRGHESLDALVAELVGSSDPALADFVIDALLNQETSFYRDAAVIAMVGEAIEAARDGDPQRRVRIWSAGCSSGQEPLSLAMLFAERDARTGARAPDIVATDVSDAAITRARLGRFSQFEVQRGLPVRQMLEWFDGQGEEWVAKPALVNRISFRRHNLVTDLPPIGRFDVILCRNVLLYFAPAVRQRIFDSLAMAIRPGGLLVLGAGETVIGQTDAFRPSPRFRGLYEPVTACQPRISVAAAG